MKQEIKKLSKKEVDKIIQGGELHWNYPNEYILDLISQIKKAKIGDQLIIDGRLFNVKSSPTAYFHNYFNRVKPELKIRITCKKSLTNPNEYVLTKKDYNVFSRKPSKPKSK